MNKTSVLSCDQLLNIFSASHIATAIYTTEYVVIEAVTQAMLDFWGKDRSIIGLPLEVAVPELLGQPFIDQLKGVLASGQTVAGRGVAAETLIDGQLQIRYYDYEYRAILDTTGKAYCILHTASDVTERVFGLEAIAQEQQRKEDLEREQQLNEELAAANEELSAINEELQQTQESLQDLNLELDLRVKARTADLEEARRRLQSMIANTPVAMTVLRGREMIIEQINESMSARWQRATGSVIGKRLLDVFPELDGQPFPQLLTEVFKTGVKFAQPEMAVTMNMPDGSERNSYVNFSYVPMLDVEGQVEAILVSVVDVTESVTNRLELERSEQELQNTTEELAATNEEMTAINEEMTASNEELVSTNEELVRIQEDLSKSAERFRFLFNAIPQQVWTAGTDGALDYVNEVVCKDFGYNNAEIVGHGWRKFIHPDDLPAALTKWLHSLKSGDEYSVEFRLLFSDGIYRWHLARALPLIEKGQVTLWVGTNTNIDLQKNNEQKKDEFLSIASHELKTPLTSIKAFNQLMSKTSDAERLAGFMGKSAQHIRRLEKLITDLLDATKVNSGKLDYNMEPFSFKRLLTESVDNIRHTSPNHEIILKNAVELDFTGDHFRLEQVLNNFLNNAVKYSPKGEKVIIDSQLDEKNITVSVQDFGIGIAPGHMEKLFDRYYRVDNTAMRFDGLGLGLFISAEILKRHEGKCWMESELGKGSTFYFQMPVIRKTQVKTGIVEIG